MCAVHEPFYCLLDAVYHWGASGDSPEPMLAGLARYLHADLAILQSRAADTTSVRWVSGSDGSAHPLALTTLPGDDWMGERTRGHLPNGEIWRVSSALVESGWHMLGAVLFRPEHTDFPPASIYLLRGVEKGEFSTSEMRRLKMLVPHLQRAWRLLETERKSGIERLVAAGIFAQQGFAGAVCAGDGRVLELDHHATTLFALRDGARLRQGFVELDALDEQRQLDRVFDSLSSSVAIYSNRQVIRVTRPSGEPPFFLLPLPLQPCSVVRLRRPDAAVLLLIREGQIRRNLNHAALEQRYQLSKAELRLANALLSGKTIKQAASLLHISDNTARSHLKAIFVKTNTHRQSELVQLLLCHPQ